MTAKVYQLSDYQAKGWYTSHEYCRLCDYTCIGVIPIEADNKKLQCGNCKNMTVQVCSKEEFEKARKRRAKKT